jgi:hypothetical protein
MKIHQIYFNESQIDQLEPGFVPTFNENCSHFFEAEVMCNLILSGAHKDSDYFGVVSYGFRHKLNNPNYILSDIKEFIPEVFQHRLYDSNPDIMAFQRSSPHDPIAWAEEHHPGFTKLWKQVMDKIGFSWSPKIYEHNIYCNYFVARNEIYAKFVEDLMIPAIEVMCEMNELWENSGYVHALPQHLQQKWNVKHYPFHPFICERLISFYIHTHQLKTAYT